MIRKGIVLAGGSSTRLAPMTAAFSKHLVPVYDKPMIYYPLTVLMLAGLRDVLLITSARDRPLLEAVLGDGSAWGMRLSYTVQERPRGIAEALILGAPFLDGQGAALILGDNIFYGHGLQRTLRRAVADHRGATVFAYPVSDPQAFGVLGFDDDGRLVDIEEKPAEPRSNLAVTGLYLFDAGATSVAEALAPSARGELEITDLNRHYLQRGALDVVHLGRGTAWFDTGTPAALLQAANFVHMLQTRQGLLIASPEEIAWRLGWIDQAQFLALAEALAHTAYGRTLLGLPRQPGP